MKLVADVIPVGHRIRTGVTERLKQVPAGAAAGGVNGPPSASHPALNFGRLSQYGTRLQRLNLPLARCARAPHSRS